MKDEGRRERSRGDDVFGTEFGMYLISDGFALFDISDLSELSGGHDGSQIVADRHLKGAKFAKKTKAKKKM